MSKRLLLALSVWSLSASAKEPAKPSDPVKARAGADAALRAAGVTVDGPTAPAAASRSGEALARELIAQLSTKNLRGVVSLLWSGEGLTGTDAETDALFRRRSGYAQGMGAAAVIGVPADAKATRISTTRLAAGGRFEGCTTMAALTVERWELKWAARPRVAVLVRPEPGEWRVVRLED
jgi:hypothetical protein